MDNQKLACFTGHRPNKLHGYDRASYRPLVAQLTGYLKQIVIDCELTGFISGGAQGFDQLAFWAVNKVRADGRGDLENRVYVPFQGQSSIWKAEGTFSQHDYNQMLRCATSVNILQPSKPADKSGIVRALHDRNHVMVRDSAVVIALWAEPGIDWHQSRGGTAECLRHAEQQGRRIIVIHYDVGRGIIDHIDDYTAARPRR